MHTFANRAAERAFLKPGSEPALQGNWNKESMIRKTLEETPAAAAEWILWVDIDTVMPDMAVLPRFDAYEGADLVVWGSRAKIMEGDLNAGAPA